MQKMFRTLRADEVECRVGQVDKEGKWCTLLLYKDARCDQNVLDETVGPMNWMRHHGRDNANCVVSIWDEGKQQWIEKEDTGTESNTEKDKGLASDSFKRACVNWGIGRELYTAPVIFVPQQGNYELKNYKGKLQPKADFKCAAMEVTAGQITYLQIVNGKMNNKVVYSFGAPAQKPVATEPPPELPPELPPEASTPQSGAPVPFDRKNGPQTVQTERERALELWRQRYPDVKTGMIAYIFKLHENMTDEEWKTIADNIEQFDYTPKIQEIKEKQNAG